MWCTSCVHHTIGLNGTLSTQCNILRPCYYRSIIDGAAEAILRRVKALCWQQFFYKDGEDKRNMKKTEFELGFLVLKTFAKIKTRIHITIDIRVVITSRNNWITLVTQEFKHNLNYKVFCVFRLLLNKLISQLKFKPIQKYF
jgi:hypothetical protein